MTDSRNGSSVVIRPTCNSETIHVEYLSQVCNVSPISKVKGVFLLPQ